MTRDELLHRVAHATYHKGEVYATNGAKLPDYFDKFGILADGVLCRDICHAIVASIDTEARMIAGFELGGAILATAVAAYSARNVLVVRKRAPVHGLRRQVEYGRMGAYRNVWVVEDTARTGTSLRYLVSLLESHGYNVLGMTVVIDREEGAREYCASHGYAFEALFTAAELREALRE